MNRSHRVPGKVLTLNFSAIGDKVYRSTRYVFIHCLWLKIEFYVNLKPWIIDPAISNANLETLAKLDTFCYFSKILGDFLKSNVITPLKIVSVCRYGERDMSTFK